jgi:flavin-dependent dehydrogenase
VIVGGGPSGSACATRLRQAGASVAVLDLEPFPRSKLCAGWITPKVVNDIDLDIEAYPHRLNSFKRLVIHVKKLTFRLKCLQYSIRRYEFDDYLLKRSGADLHTHNVRSIRRVNGSYLIDGAFRCEYLVGAGGTRCPVYRNVFREHNPRAKELQIVTLEQEFPYEWEDPDCHMWFFQHGLRGYSWYVPKADGFLNCGIGGMADKLSRSGTGIRGHWEKFITRLQTRAMVRGIEFNPRGYSYYLRQDVEHVRIGNAFITGDAAGLATRDMGEGIGPAIESAQRAADAITSGCDYRLDNVTAHSVIDIVRSRRLLT